MNRVPPRRPLTVPKPLRWRVQRETDAAGYGLSIIGRGDLWSWLVTLHGIEVACGDATSMKAGVSAASQAARDHADCEG